MYELKLFVKGDRAPFTEWLHNLKDVQARARIRTRLDRLSLGNFGDHRALEGGIYELKIDWGPGHRAYCAKTGKTIIPLLCGGDKKSQTKDIKQARAYLKEYEHAQND